VSYGVATSIGVDSTARQSCERDSTGLLLVTHAVTESGVAVHQSCVSDVHPSLGQH
jgi:hypothetical protein